MIRISVDWKLPWRDKGLDENVLVPEGTCVEELLPLLHVDDLREHVFVIRNRQMTDGTETLLAGDSIILLPVISGG